MTLRLDRRTFLGATGAALLCPAPGRARALDAIEGTAFGTTWRIDAAGADLSALGDEIKTLFAGIDAQMSPWRADSVVSGVNRGGAGAFAAPAETCAVTRAALDLTRATNGAFDPTVGPLVARWGFGPITGGPGGVQDLAVAPGRIVKARGSVTLDLCGLAKGWALDRACELAARAGAAHLLMDLGGELKALGPHPDGRPWRVGIDPPPGAPDRIVLALPPGHAVATAGHRAQSYTLNGTRYTHIVDPRSGAPARGPLFSVSVLGADAMAADGWATALFAAGAEDGPALARRSGIAALFLTDAGTTILTGPMTEHVL